MDSSAPAPDPKIGEVASRQMDLAEKQYADQTALFKEYSPILKEQLNQSVTEQAKTIERGDAQWANYTKNFQPLEGQFAKEAADWNTVGRQDQNAQRAEAGVAQQFDVASAQRAEELNAAGLLPGSGRGMTMNNAAGIEEAKARAAAGNNARMETEAQGLSLMNSAIGVGRGQVASGLQLSSLAGGQSQGVQGQYSGLSSATGAAAGQASNMFGQAAQTYTGLENLKMNGYASDQAANSANTAAIGTVAGAALVVF